MAKLKIIITLVAINLKPVLKITELGTTSHIIISITNQTVK